MDIKNVNTNIALNRSNDSFKPTNHEKNEFSAKNNASVNTDKVTLTQATAQMSHLEQTTRNINLDNNARISELKTAIQEGTYQVNAERVADKLLQTESLFIKMQ